MTDLITEARELCASATPGPWESYRLGGCYEGKSGIKANGYGIFLSAINADADFIAHSRTLIPELCDALEKAEAQIPRWIPVTERLPEIRCVEVLAIDKKGVLMASVDRSADGVWFGTNRAISGDVTHWMPLTAPPEEGAEK